MNESEGPVEKKRWRNFSHESNGENSPTKMKELGIYASAYKTKEEQEEVK